MAFHILKPIVPESLFGRFLLIIIIPMVLVPLIATYIFYERHWNSVSRHMTMALAGEVSLLTTMLSDASSNKYPSLLETANKNLYITASFEKDAAPVINLSTPTTPPLLLLHEELRTSITHPFTISYSNEENKIAIDIQLSHGVLHISTTAKRIQNKTTYIFILWMTGAATLLLAISILFSKNQIRTITRLATAAEKFGRGLEITDFKPEGAKEVRQAAKAFIRMKERIKRQVTKRTEMLAGISHDLRTPLTRMKLQLAMMEDSDEIRAMQLDITEMEKMIQEYLDFVRGEGTEPAAPVHIPSLLKDILSCYGNHSAQISLNISTDITTLLRKQAMKRTITNLCDNALRYGKHINISAKNTTDELIIIVEDDGPGIPEDKHKTVFKPFSRLDHSRNLDTGGVGLGMTIARDIVNSHGGNITLGKSTLGGLLVQISLPL